MGIYASEDSKSRRTSKLQSSYDSLRMFFAFDLLGLCWVWNKSTVDIGGVSRGRLEFVGVSGR